MFRTDPLKFFDEAQSQQAISQCNYRHTRILKSKENFLKPKCRKALKKRLKKYKLRKDGKEDADVLDVSKILVDCLKIKSPDKIEISEPNSFDQENEFTPRNYLFKMVRRKKSSPKLEMQFGKNNDNLKLKSIEHSSEPLATKDDLTANTKQMNAFKLMMDSRNKSIGTNSPGKEKSQDDSEFNEIIRKKELKAKRVLSLEKMAQEKGSIKNKEIEEYREKCIKSQMLNRAERLKLMIENNNSKIDQRPHKEDKSIDNICNTHIVDQCNDSNDNSSLSAANSPVVKKGTLKLFNFLSETDSHCIETKVIKNITEEDKDFLSKLSPSMRKKENMLSYFKKVPKDTDQDEKQLNSVIKVKFTSKRKKKNKYMENTKTPENINYEENEVSLSISDISKTREKLTKGLNLSADVTIKDTETSIESNNSRPRRNLKKPVKYEDSLSTSSDEELHIFTPKKKRIIEQNTELKPKEENVDVINLIKNKIPKQNKKNIALVSKDTLHNKNRKKHVNMSSNKVKDNSLEAKVIDDKIKHPKIVCKTMEQNKNIKLAPIFVSKSQQNPLDLEAKHKFLNSGVPESLKIKTQQCSTILPNNIFYKVVHVQQKTKNNVIPPKDWFPLTEIDTSHEFDVSEDLFEKLLEPTPHCAVKSLDSKQKPDKLLKILKSSYPTFPVYRTYHLLKSKGQECSKDNDLLNLDNSLEIANSLTEVSAESPERLNWNNKYKATSSKQIIGNFASVRELKRWLESWTEDVIKDKSNHCSQSDLSDFCFSDTDTDSKDFRHANNILVITGQVGSGKTSSVYAVAAELSMKVIEVNASSKRTGKIMLQDLQEATQSHKVNRGPNRTDSSQKSQDETTTVKKRKRRGCPKKTYERHKKELTENVEKDTQSQPFDKCSQESSRTGMSLILIDDADIIFDQDDGFCSAVSQLIRFSKRPVILITSALTCPHLQKFLLCGKILHMHPLIPRMLGTWLDIMCLADSSFCYPGFGSKMLNYYNGDIRKTINFLQYFMTSDKYFHQVEDQTLAQVTYTYQTNIDNENSNFSWVDSDSQGFQEVLDANPIKKYSDKIPITNVDVSKILFEAWWNMSSLLNTELKTESVNLNHVKNWEISKALDCISFVDYLNRNKSKLSLDIFSRPWDCGEAASVLENEHLDGYDKSNEVIIDITNELINTAVTESRCTNVDPPTTSQQRERNNIVSRHKTLTTHLHPLSVLDRRALALDYWPFCRTICRVEKVKTDINLKRNNRFCHYMKSVNVLCKNDFFDSLSESLS